MTEIELNNRTKLEISKLDRGMLLRLIDYWQTQNYVTVDVGVSFSGVVGHFDRDDDELKIELQRLVLDGDDLTCQDEDDEEYADEWFKDEFLKSIEYVRTSDYSIHLIAQDLEHENKKIARLLAE